MQFPIHDATSYKGRITFSAYQDYDKTIAETTLQSLGLKERQGRTGGYDEAGVVDHKGGRDFQRSATSAKPVPRGMGECKLYLPMAVSFADGIDYSNIDLGQIGGAAAFAIRNGVGTVDMAKQMFNTAVGLDGASLWDAALNGLSSPAGQVMALRTLGRVSDTVRGAIETETGIALNPNTRSVFKGISIRRFRFSFSMIPTSAEEAQAIKQIIQWFRVQMYPDMSGVYSGVEGVSAALTYPSKFNIDVSYGSKKIGSKILPCFLESLNVTYNPSSMAFHEDDEPQETVVSLSFIEERAMTKADVTGIETGKISGRTRSIDPNIGRIS